MTGTIFGTYTQVTTCTNLSKHQYSPAPRHHYHTAEEHWHYS